MQIHNICRGLIIIIYSDVIHSVELVRQYIVDIPRTVTS